MITPKAVREYILSLEPYDGPLKKGLVGAMTGIINDALTPKHGLEEFPFSAEMLRRMAYGYLVRGLPVDDLPEMLQCNPPGRIEMVSTNDLPDTLLRKVFAFVSPKKVDENAPWAPKSRVAVREAFSALATGFVIERLAIPLAEIEGIVGGKEDAKRFLSFVI